MLTLTLRDNPEGVFAGFWLFHSTYAANTPSGLLARKLRVRPRDNPEGLLAVTIPPCVAF